MTVSSVLWSACSGAVATALVYRLAGCRYAGGCLEEVRKSWSDTAFQWGFSLFIGTLVMLDVYLGLSVPSRLLVALW